MQITLMCIPCQQLIVALLHDGCRMADIVDIACSIQSYHSLSSITYQSLLACSHAGINLVINLAEPIQPPSVSQSNLVPASGLRATQALADSGMLLAMASDLMFKLTAKPVYTRKRSGSNEIDSDGDVYEDEPHQEEGQGQQREAKFYITVAGRKHEHKSATVVLGSVAWEDVHRQQSEALQSLSSLAKQALEAAPALQVMTCCTGDAFALRSVYKALNAKQTVAFQHCTVASDLVFSSFVSM